MKHVLILGAGLVTRPIVRYLLDQPDFRITVASRTVSKAEKLIAGHPNGEAKTLLVDDKTSLKEMISGADLVVSLVPYAYHPVVAEFCIEMKKQMVTTSYVSDAMKALDDKAKKAGVLILNEIGVDPGIDHMSAMRIIHHVEDKDGKVVSFYSYCGGLPAPEANTNPFGYKFSWSPRGVVLAGRNSGRYLKDNKIVEVENKDLFAHTWDVAIEGLGTLEAYPNRNALPYIELYGLKGISSLYRGTFRNPGWCETWNVIVNMGLLDLEERNALKGLTFCQYTAKVLGVDPKADLDLSPLLDLFVSNTDVLKVFHAGGQDLEIIYNLTGKLPQPLFDTQIAAMALGHGEQIGYSNLIESLLGHSLDKGARFTDWSRRPLEKRQIDYAIADVTHLATVFPRMVSKLKKTGRGA